MERSAMKKSAQAGAAMMLAFALIGCSGVSFTVHSAEDEAPLVTEEEAEGRMIADGPYGRLSIKVPEKWECTAYPMDNDLMTYGEYGFVLHPEDANEGDLEIICDNDFAVCGTNLDTEETVIAGRHAHIGTYNNSTYWDFITIGEEGPQIIAMHTICDSWTDEMWNAAMAVIEDARLNTAAKKGCVWEYAPESENLDAGVSMDLFEVSPTGAEVRIFRFGGDEDDEVSYGQLFTLEKKNEDGWEELPVIAEDAIFTEEAYIVPFNESSELITDWEWLYGVLPSGTYRMKKTVTVKCGGNSDQFDLYAQFIVEAPEVKKTYDGMFRTYYKMDDGTWLCDGHYYNYRLEISGRMNNAAKDSTFVYLSNIEDIPFDRAVMASGLSSDLDDYFDADEAVFVGWSD
ncbi:MAG: hypothetical protein K6F73_09160 [Lachnospiraceae bacterium]|nr:hypothetical protein [Lachnospiraceae bacterium]